MEETKRNRITYQDVHYTRSFYQRFISSLSEPIDSLVICSPYFDQLPSPFDNVLDFCIDQFRRGAKNIQIITRPPGKDSNALSVDIAKRLAAEGVEIFIRTQPYLHAKLYHFDYSRGFFRSFIGSSNFTIGGLKRNYELVAELEGVGGSSPSHREIARMRDRGAMPYNVWVSHELPEGQEETL
ncbi:phospholipase D family protein [Pelagibius marinus]|uniref:phospholipase D family protein n=1 Tax=Pelagibius marinus TaxID=2762760 RepID=UPI00187225F3|nr:phospholipase D family protein [Pelagibius marinus]